MHHGVVVVEMAGLAFSKIFPYMVCNSNTKRVFDLLEIFNSVLVFLIACW